VDRDAEGDVVLTWGASPVDGTHDAPTAYRVYRSAAPDAGFSVEALSLTTTRLLEGEGAGGVSAYWTIVAENGGGTSGDDPAP